MSHAAMSATSTGHILNLVTNDVQTLDQVCDYFLLKRVLIQTFRAPVYRGRKRKMQGQLACSVSEYLSSILENV